MKTISFLVVMIVLATNLFGQYNVNESKFKLTFPGNATKSEQNVETAIGNVVMVSYMYEGTEKIYMMAYTDYPAEKIKNSTPAEMLQGAKNGFVNELKMNTVFEREINIKGNSGIFFKAKSDELYVVVKDYLVSNRLYQIAVMGLDGFPEGSEVDKYFDSFKLK